MREKERKTRKQRKGRSPRPVPPLMHLFKKRVPSPGVEVTAPILVESMPGASILLGYVERFPETEVVLES